MALAAGGDHFGAMQDAGRTVIAHIEPNRTHLTSEEERNGPPQSAPESHLFRTGPPRLARNTVIESTFEVGRRYQCTMRIDCSQLEPATKAASSAATILPAP
jgi:hypothetical protein